MGPPAGGDPIGVLILIAGVVITIAAIALAIKFTFWPGETDLNHPKYRILRNDR
jgi:hypothetical protein